MGRSQGCHYAYYYHKGHCSRVHSYAQMSFVPKLGKVHSIILDANSTLEGPPLAGLGVLSVWMAIAVHFRDKGRKELKQDRPC